MKRPFQIWVTNLTTSEIEVIDDISDYYYVDYELFSRFLFSRLKKYFDMQIPIKLELVYKKYQK